MPIKIPPLKTCVTQKFIVSPFTRRDVGDGFMTVARARDSIPLPHIARKVLGTAITSASQSQQKRQSKLVCWLFPVTYRNLRGYFESFHYSSTKYSLNTKAGPAAIIFFTPNRNSSHEYDLFVSSHGFGRRKCDIGVIFKIPWERSRGNHKVCKVGVVLWNVG